MFTMIIVIRNSGMIDGGTVPSAERRRSQMNKTCQNCLHAVVAPESISMPFVCGNPNNEITAKIPKYGKYITVKSVDLDDTCELWEAKDDSPDGAFEIALEQEEKRLDEERGEK